MSDRRRISAVMPARNDRAHLWAAATSVLDQVVDADVDLVIAVGPSDDGTEAEAERLADAHTCVSVVANPSGGTAAGLNQAIAAARGSIIARVDAHCVLPPGYLARAVETLERTGAANVGGVQHAVGSGTVGRAVAAAMGSRFGVGDARFHYGGAEGPADTAYLGVFDAAVLRSVGGFDESLVRNQDYELNWRLRDSGHVVWFDPELVVRYHPREGLGRLARQYFDYGRWKREMLRRNPRALRLRQLAPPLTLVGVTTGLLGAATGRRWMIAAPVVYAAAVLGATVAAPALDPRARMTLGAVFPTMHGAWGAGFLIGVRDRAQRVANVAPR
ncbi:MAG: glycosyltransferase family 2 protein [Acidimicrobiales bacterium]